MTRKNTNCITRTRSHYRGVKFLLQVCLLFLCSVFLFFFSSPGVSILSHGWQTLSDTWHMDHSFDSTITFGRSAYASARPENSRNVCLALINPLRANNEFMGCSFRHNRWNGDSPRCIHWQKSWWKCHGETGGTGDVWRCWSSQCSQKTLLHQFEAIRNEINVVQLMSDVVYIINVRESTIRNLNDVENKAWVIIKSEQVSHFCSVCDFYWCVNNENDILILSSKNDIWRKQNKRW